MSHASGNDLRVQAGHKWWALAAVCFGLFMALLDVTIVNVALPTIQRDLTAPFDDLEWVVNAYTLVFAVALVTCGRLGDIFGRKRVFMCGLAVFSLGSLLCALSGDIHLFGLSHSAMLIAARAVQGLGGSAMAPLSLAIISATFHGRERGTAIGIWGGVSGLATAIGPLVGGVLVEKVNWQSIFWINVPIGVVGIALSLWAISESRDERAPRSIDLYGLVTVTVFLFCLVLAFILVNHPDKGWTSPYILTLFGIALVALVAFVVGELLLKHPMLDPRLFKNPSFTGAAIAGFTLSAGFYALFFFLTMFFQNRLSFSALDTGLRFLPMSGLVFVGAPLAGRLTDKIGPKWVLATGMGLLTVGVLLMTRIGSVSTPSEWVWLLPAFIVAGVGNGVVNPPISAIAVGTVEPYRAGMASGANNVCRQVGLAFGIAFLSALLSKRYDTLVQSGVAALRTPGLSDSAKGSIVKGIQSAGTIAGSTGLRGEPNPYTHNPLFPKLSTLAQTSFATATADILWAAAVTLCVGFVAVVILVRRQDLKH
ncbi:MFS transporter [Alicyclobacillus kakegawensis]|uniref:MFS transporter n=1 Tax=Alicyclobacillus kakegawensis TaxID=392012 RepID=UPI0008324ADE|nr:MFS transporter [Alicyclobacillus kakegawensis]